MIEQAEATMDRIYYWRNKVRQAQHSLEAACQSDLPPGTHVAYTHGSSEIIVVVVRSWGPHRCQVKNRDTGRKYLLDYARIDRVVEQA